MLLKITKSQEKNWTRGLFFNVKHKLVLTDDEAGLINNCGLQNQPLGSSTAVSHWSGGTTELVITVDKLLFGKTQICKSLVEALDYREQLIEACESLRLFLIAAANFEGTEEIDFDALLEDVEEDDIVWVFTRARFPWLVIAMVGGRVGAVFMEAFEENNT